MVKHASSVNKTGMRQGQDLVPPKKDMNLYSLGKNLSGMGGQGHVP